MLTKNELRIGRFRIPTAMMGTTGPIIVGVNGAQQTMGSWLSFVRHFAPRGFRVVLFDFPGQGRAQVQHGNPALDLADQVAITASVLETFSPDAPVNLIGGSWGAVICAATAALHPARVGQLLLGSFRTAPNATLLAMAADTRRYIEEERTEKLAEIFVDGFGAGLPETKKEQIRLQMSNLPRAHALQLHALSFLCCEGADIRQHVDLRQVSARTLILNGAADPIVDEDNLREALGLIPNCCGHLVPGVGHFLHAERPALLATYEAFFRGGNPSIPAS